LVTHSLLKNLLKKVTFKIILL